ncbi:MAG: hypothetical protein HUU20_19460 [Pirellulales bacterium]|nr:hypothetical protein [Pirellulales bacterium]
MSEHDETLRKALEENARLRSEWEESLRENASAEYSRHLRTAERVYWVYALVCVVLGVAAIRGFFFAAAPDTKTMIGCAVVILVIYETTVLMKLWFAMAAMKMTVLKDLKLLRLEVARLGEAAGVQRAAGPTVQYEPVRGASKWERRFWFAACLVAAIATSSWTAREFARGGAWLVDATTVTLEADGSATSVTEIEHPYQSRLLVSKEFPYYAPKGTKIRFVDPQGEEMPVKITETSGHTRHDVTLTDAVFANGMMRYTRISETPKAAARENGVWKYQSDFMYSKPENRFNVTVRLPKGAELVSAEPAPTLQSEQDGRTTVQFRGSRAKNERFAYAVKYEVNEN